MNSCVKKDKNILSSYFFCVIIYDNRGDKMATEISSKTELQSISGDLASKVETLKGDMDSMKSVLDGAEDYDGINVTGPANILKSNLDIIVKDMEAVSTNITNYANAIAAFDNDDFAESIFSQDVVLDAPTEQAAQVLTDTTNNQTLSDDTVQWTQVNAATGNSASTVNSGYSGYSSSGSSSSGSSSSGSSSSGSSSGSSGYIAGAIAGGTLIAGTAGDGSDWDFTDNVGDSRDINGSMTVTPSGKTSADGRTQRSALKTFTIKNGVKNNPDLDISKYHNNLKAGFEVTTGNLTYDLCEEDIELLCAIVAAESDKSYDDSLAVVSTILNRCETSNWINVYGRDPIAQVTAPDQYVTYQYGTYEKYMNDNVPDTVKQAVADALAGVRNNNYTSYRSNGLTEYSNNTITETGNRYK